MNPSAPLSKTNEAILFLLDNATDHFPGHDAVRAAGLAAAVRDELHIIQPGTKIVTLKSSTHPSAFGQTVTFTAHVVGDPNGTVTFKDGETVLGTSALVNGVATFTAPSLILGNHAITAVYDNASVTPPPTSGVLHQIVNPVDPGAPTPKPAPPVNPTPPQPRP